MRGMRIISRLAILAPALLLLGCSEKEDHRGAFQADLALLDRSLDQTAAAHHELRARANNLRVLLEELELEFQQEQNSALAAARTNSELRSAIFRPDGRLHEWALPPRSNPYPLILVAVFLVGLWALWRLKNQRAALLMDSEINRVIARLREEAKSSSGQPPPGPAYPPVGRPGPAAPQPPPAQETTQPAPEAEPVPEAVIEEATAPIRPSAPDKPEAKAPEQPEPTEPVAPSPREAAPKARPSKKKSAPARSGRLKKDKKEGRKKPLRKSTAGKCKVKGCNNLHRSKGFCNKHYQQWRRGNLTEETE